MVQQTIQFETVSLSEIGSGAVTAFLFSGATLEATLANITENATLKGRYTGTVDDKAAAAYRLVVKFDGYTVSEPDETVTLLLAVGTYVSKRLAVLDSADKDTLVDLIWDEPLTGATHNVATSSGKRLRQTTAFQQIDSTVIDASATTTTFVTGLTSSVDNFYNDSMLVFTDGALAGQVRAIYDYIGATKTIVLEEALTSAPVNGVAFAIVSLHIHPVSQIQNGLATSAELVTLRGVDNDTLKTLSDQIDTVSADVSSIASVSREAF
jgi:hypothetical protein